MKKIIFTLGLLLAAASTAVPTNSSPQLTHADSAMVAKGQATLHRIIDYLDRYQREHQGRYPEFFSPAEIKASEEPSARPLSMSCISDSDYKVGADARWCSITVQYSQTHYKQSWSSTTGLTKIWEETPTKLG